MSGTEEKKPKKGGKLKKLMIPLIAIIVLGGGGAAGGYFAAGALGGSHEAEDPNAPKLVMKDGSHVSAGSIGAHGAEAKKLPTHNFKVTYYPIEQPFTSNLHGGGGFAQVALAVSTYYDEKVTEALTEHDIAVRSAVLMTLAEADAEELETTPGKEKLKIALKNVINRTLEEKTGFGGIDDVYFTSFVVQ